MNRLAQVRTLVILLASDGGSHPFFLLRRLRHLA
jgi:hypothetical protein